MIRDYLKWFRTQYMWWLILGSQAIVVALNTSHRTQYAFVLFWAFLTSLYNHMSDEWKDMYFRQRRENEMTLRTLVNITNRLRNMRNPENS